MTQNEIIDQAIRRSLRRPAEYVVTAEDRAQLTRIDLWGTAITDAGLAHLAGMPLTEISLWHTAITNAGVARLRAMLPGCKIYC